MHGRLEGGGGGGDDGKRRNASDRCAPVCVLAFVRWRVVATRRCLGRRCAGPDAVVRPWLAGCGWPASMAGCLLVCLCLCPSLPLLPPCLSSSHSHPFSLILSRPLSLIFCHFFGQLPLFPHGLYHDSPSPRLLPHVPRSPKCPTLSSRRPPRVSAAAAGSGPASGRGSGHVRQAFPAPGLWMYRHRHMAVVVTATTADGDVMS